MDPIDGGRIALLCARPAPGERTELEQAHLTPTEGLIGDRSSKNKDQQLALMATSSIGAIAPRHRWSLAGDQVFVDLDLSEDNLPPGTRLRLGTAAIEITPHPHLGCAKFAQRFGPQALRRVSAREHRQQRLRGVYARVIKAGTVTTADRLWKEDTLYHLLEEWHPDYRPEEDGFVHLCEGHQAQGVWQRWFSRRGGLKVLSLKTSRLTPPIIYENGFPHLYGPIDPEAITAILPLERLIPCGA